MSIDFGCQTYTWQMSYEKYKDEFAHILQVIAQAGFVGVEAEVCMLGRFYESPAQLSEELEKNNLTLAALTLALPWSHREETDEEKQEADRLIQYLRHFPEAKLILVQLPGEDRSNLKERQINGLRCANTVAKRAHDHGMIAAFHPNSPFGSVFRTLQDYDVMFDGLDSRYLGYCPDSGHIANGNMDVMDIFRKSRDIIRHVHFKDISGDKQWKAMGEGVIDHDAIAIYLSGTGYNGWIMVEEESEEAEVEPDKVTLHNGANVKKMND